MLRLGSAVNATTNTWTTVAPAADTFPYGWAIGGSLGGLVLLLLAFVLVFKLSSHWHAHVVKTSVPRPPIEPLVKPSLPIPGTLRLLTLNIFLRPWGIADDSSDDHKEVRLKGFCDTYLDHYDVLCLQECFSTLNYRKAWFIKLAVKRGFRYFAESPPPDFCSKKFVDGGLLILSRLPFDEAPSYHSYTEGVGADGAADKGVLHVAIRLPTLSKDTDAETPESKSPTKPERQPGDVLHIFSTHLQATYARVDWAAARVQVHQLNEMRAFIDSKTKSRPQDHVCATSVLCANVDRCLSVMACVSLLSNFIVSRSFSVAI